MAKLGLEPRVPQPLEPLQQHLRGQRERVGEDTEPSQSFPSPPEQVWLEGGKVLLGVGCLIAL